MKQTKFSDYGKKNKWTKEKIHKHFVSEARNIWGDTVDKLNFKVRIGDNINQHKKKRIVPASLEHSGDIRHKAIGRTLIGTSKNMTLQIHPTTLKERDSKIIDTLRHEALHIGYKNHDRDFIRLAEKMGISVSYDFDGKIKIKEQRGKGKRFKIVATADNEREARSIAKKLMSRNREKQYRYMLEW